MFKLENVFVIFLLILLAYLVSGIYIHQLKPSDLIAGYVFSAVWLTGMAFSLESSVFFL